MLISKVEYCLSALLVVLLTNICSLFCPISWAHITNSIRWFRTSYVVMASRAAHPLMSLLSSPHMLRMEISGSISPRTLIALLYRKKIITLGDIASGLVTSHKAGLLHVIASSMMPINRIFMYKMLTDRSILSSFATNLKERLAHWKHFAIRYLDYD